MTTKTANTVVLSWSAVERHGPLPNQLKIVIRIEAPFVVAVHPFVRGLKMRANLSDGLL
jgi:hypothetical protein